MTSSLEHASTLLRLGRLREAEDLVRQCLKQDGDNPKALNILGSTLLAAGRYKEAVDAWEQALPNLEPNAQQHRQLALTYAKLGDRPQATEHASRAVSLSAGDPAALIDLGIAFSRLGIFGAALCAFDNAIQHQPENIHAHCNRGNALHGLGLRTEAQAAYRGALAIDGNHVETLNNLAALLRDEGHPGDAIPLLHQALRVRSDYRDALVNLSLAYKDQRQFPEARRTIETALARLPRDPGLLSVFGEIALEQGNLAIAKRALESSLALNPNDGETYNLLGRAFYELDRIPQAERALRTAIRLNAEAADPWNNLGNVLRAKGLFEEAQGAYERALAVDANMPSAHLNLTDLKKYRHNDDPHLLTIERLLAQPQPLDTQIRLNFAAGKIYEDIERYDDAFEHFSRGCKLKRAIIEYNEEQELENVTSLSDIFDESLMAGLVGSASRSSRPIFIVGMPRSGTTLIEQILAGAPDLEGCGELSDLGQVIDVHMSRHRFSNVAEWLSAISPTELVDLAEAYLRRINARTAASRFIDKMPHNFRFVGLIHLIFPNAKIVHAVRDPADTCVSCFTKLFGANLNWSYDLAEVGRYYRAYNNVMMNWRRILPPQTFLDVRYEDLVQDLEGQSRRLLQYCDLEWNPRILEYFRSPRTVKTASAVQVRQNIYVGSVARWRNYASHLSELWASLQQPPCRQPESVNERRPPPLQG